ncbi:hypothetical protein AZA_89959 [Nitrospirillum viridazoti Y2]|nr:hypothetical protein AZA_89959 [Nitrospirillum amazonense Y2]
MLAAEVLFRAAQRLETLDGEIAKLNGQKSDVFRELKVKGFDIAILRRVLRDSRIDPLVRKERDTTHALYLQALEVEKAKS